MAGTNINLRDKNMPDKLEDVQGNLREELCICKLCGTLDLYEWKLYVDHFPLKCCNCGQIAVERVNEPLGIDVIDGLMRRAKSHERLADKCDKANDNSDERP